MFNLPRYRFSAEGFVSAFTERSFGLRQGMGLKLIQKIRVFINRFRVVEDTA